MSTVDPARSAEYVCEDCGALVPRHAVRGGGHLVSMPTEWTLKYGMAYDLCGPLKLRHSDGDVASRPSRTGES